MAHETYPLLTLNELANQVPFFPPLGYWTPECHFGNWQSSGAAHTTAADVHGVGNMMASVNLQLNDGPLMLKRWLSLLEPEARPGAHGVL